MDVKKARHEKFVIGSFGSSVVGIPSSSTSGGWSAAGAGTGSVSDSFVSSRVRRIGGGNRVVRVGFGLFLGLNFDLFNTEAGVGAAEVKKACGVSAISYR